jgi:hypothetical protein
LPEFTDGEKASPRDLSQARSEQPQPAYCAAALNLFVAGLKLAPRFAKLAIFRKTKPT